MPVVNYDPRGLDVVTWGQIQRMTWAFFATYCSEAYAILSEDFVYNGKAPNGFDVETLQRDLRAL